MYFLSFWLLNTTKNPKAKAIIEISMKEILKIINKPRPIV